MDLNVSQCIRKDNLLHQVQNSVRSVEGCSKIKLDGSQGMVSGATVVCQYDSLGTGENDFTVFYAVF